MSRPTVPIRRADSRWLFEGHNFDLQQVIDIADANDAKYSNVLLGHSNGEASLIVITELDYESDDEFEARLDRYYQDMQKWHIDNDGLLKEIQVQTKKVNEIKEELDKVTRQRKVIEEWDRIWGTPSSKELLASKEELDERFEILVKTHEINVNTLVRMRGQLT